MGSPPGQLQCHPSEPWGAKGVSKQALCRTECRKQPDAQVTQVTQVTQVQAFLMVVCLPNRSGVETPRNTTQLLLNSLSAMSAPHIATFCKFLT